MMVSKTKKPAYVLPPGRPSLYCDEMAEKICSRLSEGEPLQQICRDPGMPSPRTVGDWKHRHESFSAKFARAREDGFDAIAEECLRIADDIGNDTVCGENGERANTEWISRSKLRVETRLKLLAKWDPKRYGDQMKLTGDGPNGAVMVVVKDFTGRKEEADAAD